MAQTWLRGTGQLWVHGNLQESSIQNLIQLNMKTNGKKSSPALAKGQLWKTEKGHIQIVDLGKLLVHYKMLRDLRQMRRTQMSRIDSMVAYLKTNGAQLVENSAATA